MKNLVRFVSITALLSLAACSSEPPPAGVKVGKPYSINGKMYYPEYDPSYDEKGVASWYGPGFHGKSTANGERFNQHDLTAAHPTLPMPSLVRVTNLENDKSAVVRINDRGPFAHGRIIDLSKSSAQRLGISGLAKVRVEYLAKESEDYIAAAKEGRRIDMFAYNEQLENKKDTTLFAATAPSDQSFIVESTNNQSQPGDAVTNAAPIVSVSGADIPPPQQVAQAAPEQKKRRGGLLISDAEATETQPARRGGEVVLTSPSIEASPAAGGEPEAAAEAPQSLVAVRTPSAGGYYVQVGSFSRQDNANRLRSQIASAGPASVEKVKVNGGGWWRLRAGPFENEQDAAAALEKIRTHAPDAKMAKL